ncbi:DNA-binding LacI/PurR family transcriptional regulator/AraC-like DNA-binding protein/signal transduction histidine kinase [Streptomyces sp. V3I8]|uniref:substrate-binding domain-containing protein n=1 Tax=Streptomyces sp. V3I8 TaxID=3042279 RepID=UPI002781965E|nr:substrate-binding domain-containing protein [Streptomyces sp. V3I8]MDQ1041120.1 DNA-binding LacI/PurR family transcriptional regulator/AraC-like DNA-binding protein/signal transduction histidine kinase [Streptomyces sp. V3I8]
MNPGSRTAPGTTAAGTRAAGTSHGPDRPLTVGLLTANIHLGVGATLWSGARTAAERNDVNLVCFPGGNLRHGDVTRSELYELVGPARLDGVVCWSSTLGLPSSGPRARRLLRRLAHLPLISLNQPLSDQTDVLSIDSHAGMRKLVGHLVVQHGRRKPACIHGPLANPVSEERYRACVDALRHHGIRDEHVGAAVDFAAAAGASAMQVLLEARGLTPGVDFDVVLACSDVLAAGALRHLTERGIRVPEDVAVVGFNDSPEARLGDPPLTSVALPFEELGALAVDTLVARLRGTRPPDRTTIPATLVPRRSCGCPYPTSYRPSPVPAAPATARRPEGWDALDALPASGGPRLAAAFRAELARADSDPRPPANDEAGRPGGFLPLVEQLLRSSAGTQAEVDRWHQVLEAARRGVVDTLPSPLRRAGEALFGQARLVVAERSRALLEYERWSQTQRARRLREFGTALTTVVDLEGLSDVLERHLGQSGVPHCRIVLYDRNADASSPAALGTARPLLARAEAGQESGSGGPLDSPAFSPALLLPDSLLPRDGRFTLVLEPLHIGEEHLGVAVFEAAPGGAAYHDGALYRELGDQISAALKGIGLFDEVRRARDAAEQASRFQTRLLTHVTDELRTPVEAMLHHSGDPGAALAEVRRDAVRVLHLMENLLDLARSEAGDLLLTRRLMDPLPVLAQACAATASALPAAGSGPGPGWTLDLPARLPPVWVDGTRLRQILHNVLISAAARAKDAPPLVAAALGPAGVRITVSVPDARTSATRPGQLLDVGVTTARRLAMMHGGALTVSDSTGRARYVLELPLPSPDGQAHLADAGDAPLLVVTPGEFGADVREHAARHGLEVVRTDAATDPMASLARRTPGAVVWDARPDRPQEWRAVQRLYDHPALRHTPFALFGAEGADLPQALRALRPAGFAEPVVVAGGSQESRESLRRLAETALPDHPARVSTDATTLLALVADETPRLVVLERGLPDLQALDVVDRLHDGTGRALCPVVIADHEGMTAADARRGRQHPALLMLDMDVFAPHEAAALVRELAGQDSRLPSRTRDVLDEALVYLYEHWRRPISRWQVAQAAGVSPDHLGKLFQQRYGLTVWDYLTRLRIRRAADRLRSSDDSVQSVARAVGFRDRAYFSRVFRRVTGTAPHHYREKPTQANTPRDTPTVPVRR